MPIYYVIAELQRNPPGIWASIFNILEVIECDYSDIEQIYQDRVAPLQYGSGRSIQTFIFIREPDNSFREWKNK